MLPCNILNCTSNCSIEDQLNREGGSIPERLFPKRTKIRVLWVLPNPDGIEPVSWFVLSSRASRRDRFASDAGMGPVKMLFVRESTARDVSLTPSSAGMCPPRVLLPSSIMVMPTQELRLAGNVPEKELSLRMRFFRRRRLPRLAGMSPWSELKLRSSSRRNVRFPMAGESGPVSLVPFNISATTRAGLQGMQITPSQLQKLVLLFQEASEPPSLSCALKASNAASSLAVTMAAVRMARNEHSQPMTPFAIAMPLLVLLVWLAAPYIICLWPRLVRVARAERHWALISWK
ncbi:hypothetical protein CFC21_054578 [Triticum aestivum]|uniref:Uncharacterized protein n=2 Tax=Triticum aestivum TaxID=4565 RepID=A0A9R1K945_WHEAT|nr:hypothetical protein CFC21_054578 [Triticum aestivum]